MSLEKLCHFLKILIESTINSELMAFKLVLIQEQMKLLLQRDVIREKLLPHRECM